MSSVAVCRLKSSGSAKKLTRMKQLFVGCNGFRHKFKAPKSSESPPGTAASLLLMFTAELPVFVTVTTAMGNPKTGTLPKFTLAGDGVTGPPRLTITVSCWQLLVPPTMIGSFTLNAAASNAMRMFAQLFSPSSAIRNPGVGCGNGVSYEVVSVIRVVGAVMAQVGSAVPVAVKHLASITTQLLLFTVPVMTVQVVGGEMNGPWLPPEKVLPSTPVSRLALNTVGDTWMKLISIVATPPMFASGGIVIFWFMKVSSMKLTVVPGATANGPTVTVFEAGPIATPIA